ncbi:hypothetical protein [Nostoc sp.]|uniref:hypothetical protein n=2 Tax=Nostoc TaxID=1177 RepID=UPI002FF05442
MMDTPIIKLPPEAYMKIVAGKPIQIFATSLILGKRHKLVNTATGTYMFRCLHSVIGDWSYWVK